MCPRPCFFVTYYLLLILCLDRHLSTFLFTSEVVDCSKDVRVSMRCCAGILSQCEWSKKVGTEELFLRLRRTIAQSDRRGFLSGGFLSSDSKSVSTGQKLGFLVIARHDPRRLKKTQNELEQNSRRGKDLRVIAHSVNWFYTYKVNQTIGTTWPLVFSAINRFQA
jgi:hypothetical protein